MSKLGNCIGRRRAAVGFRQQELARRAGISRQTLSVLEAGRSVPSATVALRLARALDCSVEDLFWVSGAGAPIAAEIADAGGGDQPGQGSRVVLSRIDDRWVAHPLEGDDPASFSTAADGVVSGKARIAPLDDLGPTGETLLCAGCAPAFGLLAARAGADRARERVVWLERSSGAALELLSKGQIHVAGAHLYDEVAGEFNVPFVQRLLPGRSLLIFNLAHWEAGLLVAPGNPRRITGVRDLARSDVSFVGRQPGAAAHDLLERLLRREGMRGRARIRPRLTARGHMEAARLVALGVADTGIALPSVARAHGLGFIPLAEERFDLIVAKQLSGDRRVARLLETLAGRGFRRELDSLGGHVSREAGRLIADTSAAPGTAGTRGA